MIRSASSDWQDTPGVVYDYRWIGAGGGIAKPLFDAGGTIDEDVVGLASFESTDKRLPHLLGATPHSYHRSARLVANTGFHCVYRE